MNRIRKLDDNKYQVLITPTLNIFPDSPLLVGNWDDESLRNYKVLTFETLNEAQCEAFKYPDIDWYRFILNHQPIIQRLEILLRQIVDEFQFDVQFIPKLMTPEEFKNRMFDRVLLNGQRFNLKYDFSDIISFTIANPWSMNLYKLAKIIENYKVHLHRDDLRIKHKKILDGKIISLIGITEFGTTYEIKLLPTMLYQWALWVRKNPEKTDGEIKQVYSNQLKLQGIIDKNQIIR